MNEEIREAEEVLMLIKKATMFADPIMKLSTIGIAKLIQFSARMAKEKIIEIIGNDSIAKGSTVTLMANAYNVEGGEVAPVDITWSLPDGNDSGNLVLTGDQLEVKSSATGSSVKVKATATGFTEATKTITLTGE